MVWVIIALIASFFRYFPDTGAQVVNRSHASLRRLPEVSGRVTRHRDDVIYH